MGNCLAHEPKRSNSKSSSSVVPLTQLFDPENTKNITPPPSKDVSKKQINPNLSVREVGEKEVVRIKLVMTKKEAAQFLSRLAEDKRRTANRGPVEPGLGRDGWRPALDCIPENC